MARIVGVNMSRNRTDPKVNVGEGELRAGHGLVGDSHAGLSEREISLLGIEDIEEANRTHHIAAVPGSFAENLTVEGLDLLALKPGDRLQAGQALLEVVQIGKPSNIAHTYSYQGVSSLPQKGVFCRVVKSGHVSRGDAIRVLRRRKP